MKIIPPQLSSFLAPVHIFWDNSNIYIPSQFVANKREGGLAGKEIRIYFQNLYALARAGRPVNGAVCAGSVTILRKSSVPRPPCPSE